MSNVTKAQLQNALETMRAYADKQAQRLQAAEIEYRRIRDALRAAQLEISRKERLLRTTMQFNSKYKAQLALAS